MEVKVGIAQATRELVFDVDESLDTLEVMITDALKNNRVLVLGDSKGKRSVIPSEKIVYVEIGGSTPGSVGFR